ncbi:nuclear transport factor 2 family protein [Azorhizophilus paspali]|uniref:Nuclear transport factor 2 family protein n=1 Tax=Azorhizophilus paspali TaxID=69963 RepID=A0ABV6SN76_AZOPA
MMSSIALKTVQAWYRTGDPQLLSPDIEWRVLESFPSGGLYRGRQVVIDRFFPAVKAHFAAYETRPETFMADGDTVIATGRYRVQGRSGIAADVDFAHVWTVRDGVIVAFRQIADTAALNAVLS